MGNFDDLTDKVFKLYGGGEHASALSLAESGFEQFPNRRATLIYWCACLKSLLGEPASALEDLKDGLAAGLWWAEPMLREDADLDGVRQLDTFVALLAESARRWREAMSGASPPPTILPAATAHRATLVVSSRRLRSRRRGCSPVECCFRPRMHRPRARTRPTIDF